jgi:hypothetical protein
MKDDIGQDVISVNHRSNSRAARLEIDTSFATVKLIMNRMTRMRAL